MTLNDVLWVLKNPVRRKILSKVAREVHYPLQLSKELNVSQQSVMKHLKVLEDNGFLKSKTHKSPSGPPRKLYYPRAHFSLDIYMSNNTFRIEFKDHSHLELSKLPTISDVASRDAGEKVVRYAHELERCINTPSSRECLKRISRLITDMNREIVSREDQRDLLLKIRSTALRIGRQLVTEMSDDYTTREILYYFLEKNRLDVNKLSDELDIRIKIINKAMGELLSE